MRNSEPNGDAGGVEAAAETAGTPAGFSCPECGRECKTNRARAVHRAIVHGVHGKSHADNVKYAKARKKGKGKRGRKAGGAAGVVEEGGIPMFFEQAVTGMKNVRSVMDQCVQGLELLMGEALELRKAYLQNAARLKKLQARAAELNAGNADEEG